MFAQPRTNLQHGTLVGSILAVCTLVSLRLCSWGTFLAVAVLPLALYGLFGSRTHALGSLRGKSVLVTGASSGIGRAIALAAAARGAKMVVLVARSRAGLEETAAEMRSTTPRAESVVLPADATEPSEARKVADTLASKGVSVQLLVNCAGSGDWLPISRTSPEAAAAHMACPYGAAYNVTHALLPSLLAAAAEGGGAGGGGAHVLNVTSAAAFTAWRGAASYGAARWAMRGFTDFLRCEVKAAGVGVTLLNPGQVKGTGYHDHNAVDFGHLPWLFALGLNHAKAYDCGMVAERALRGCESGECEVHVPGPAVHSIAILSAIAPSFVWRLVDFEPPAAIKAFFGRTAAPEGAAVSRGAEIKKTD